MQHFDPSIERGLEQVWMNRCMQNKSAKTLPNRQRNQHSVWSAAFLLPSKEPTHFGHSVLAKASILKMVIWINLQHRKVEESYFGSSSCKIFKTTCWTAWHVCRACNHKPSLVFGLVNVPGGIIRVNAICQASSKPISSDCLLNPLSTWDAFKIRLRWSLCCSHC